MRGDKLTLPAVGLDGDELERAMKHLMQNAIPQNTVINISFLGVFPFDCVPLAEFTGCHPRSKFCIVNTDPSHLPGKHWLALFKPHSQSNFEFFDSFGKSPAYYHFPLDARAIPDFSTLRLQSYTTRVCGHYCLLFLYARIILSMIPANSPPSLLLKRFLPRSPALASRSRNASPSPLLYICKILQSQANGFETRDAFVVQTLKCLLAMPAINSGALPIISRPLLSPSHVAQSCAPFALGAVNEGDEELVVTSGAFQ